MAFYIVVRKSYAGAGRDRDKIYVNVVLKASTFRGTFAELLLLAPWNDPKSVDFAAEITKQEYDDFKNDVVLRFHHGLGNQPTLQYNTTTAEFGSWVDPTDDATVWQPGVQISDDRFIVNIFDGNPLSNGEHVALIQLDESNADKTMNFRLFNSDGTPNDTNENDKKINLGDKLITLSFTKGIASFKIAQNIGGVTGLNSDGTYHIVGPAGEEHFQVEIYANTLRAES